MRLVLLDGGVVDEADVVVDVEGEEGAALAARLDHDEVVEGVGLRDDEVLLHVHQLVRRHRLQVGKVHAQNLERLTGEGNQWSDINQLMSETCRSTSTRIDVAWYIT